MGWANYRLVLGKTGEAREEERFAAWQGREKFRKKVVSLAIGLAWAAWWIWAVYKFATEGHL